MTTRLVIYPNDDGAITVMHPAQESGLTVEDCAHRFVPNGKPYKYITTDDLPTDENGNYDRNFREAWEADFSSPDGYGA